MIDIAVLGPSIVRRSGSDVPVPGATQRALLTLLVVHRWRAIDPDRLAEDLWGVDGPRNPRNALQQAVVKLRAALREGGDGIVRTEPAGYRLARDEVRVDVDRFAALVDHGRHDLATGNLVAAQRRFQEALALWRGRPFADLLDPATGQAEAARLDELRLTAVEGRIDTDLGLGRHESVVVELGPLLDAHPLRERLWWQLLVALYRCGRQADALDAYRRARATLVEQVGAEPGEELARVHGLILAHDPSLLLPAAPVDDDAATSVYGLLDAAGAAAAALSDADRQDDDAALVLAVVTTLNRRPAVYVHDRWLATFAGAAGAIDRAVDWCVRSGDADTALALVVEAARWWDHRRLLDTARDALARAVGCATEPSSKRSEALTWLAFFEAEQGDLDLALAHLRDAVADAGASSDRAREAGAGAVASVLLRDRDPVTARRHATDALDLFVAHGTRPEIAYGWTCHALAVLAAGSPHDAAGSAAAAATIYAELGDRRGLAWTRATQAQIATALGDADEAAVWRQEARTLAAQVDDVRALDDLARSADA